MAGTLNQGHSRLRNDDGTEITATWFAPQDFSPDVPVDTNLRWRVESYPAITSGTSVSKTTTPKFEYSTDNSTWHAVSGASSVIKSHTSTHFSDGDVTTAQLSDPIGNGGPFVAGQMDTNGIAGASVTVIQNSLALTGNWSEHEFCFMVVSTDVTAKQKIWLRISNNGTPYDVYDSPFFVTVLNTPAGPEQDSSFPHMWPM